MAAVSVNNPPTPTESKSAKKKKAMAESSGNVQSATIAPTDPTITTTSQDGFGLDGGMENPYVRELQK